MHKEIIIPIYDCLVSIQVTLTMDEAVKHLTDTYGIIEDEDLSNMGGFCNSDNSPLIDRQIYYLVVGYTLDKKEYWATIAHETMHLIQEVLESRDIYYQRKQPNEPYAYMYGYFISENFEFFEGAYSKYKRLKIKKIT
jgi:hypothetical protein